MYAIYHEYDVDGGFGDAVPKSVIVAICEDEKLAEEYAREFDKTHVYDIPYAKLYCGSLRVHKFNPPLITSENRHQSPWGWTWMPEGFEEDDDEEEED